MLATMADDPPRADGPRHWPTVAGLCLLVGTAEGLWAGLDPRSPLGLFEQLGMNWAHWGAWALIFPLFPPLVQRFPLDAGRRRRSLAAYFVLAPIVIAGHAAVHLLIASRFVPFTEGGEAEQRTIGIFLGEFARFEVGFRLLGYMLALAVALGLEYHTRATETARHAATLEAQLAQARFETLKAQLNPHFLFNTLNSISALLHRDPAGADRMLSRLGEFLRLTLENGAGPEVALADELRFTRCYLAIQEVRFSDRLTTEISVEPGVENALVPQLMLQPLVENAVRHGIQRMVGGGRIRISAARSGPGLRVEVSDNGPGPPPAGGTSGVGLANTAARLEALYGDRFRFDTSGGPGQGFRVTIELPYRPATEATCAS